ncbi:MAG: hypothetical protein EPN34_09360, partial [Burkholderiaceae bacterium]
MRFRRWRRFGFAFNIRFLHRSVVLDGASVVVAIAAAPFTVAIAPIACAAFLAFIGGMHAFGLIGAGLCRCLVASTEVAFVTPVRASTIATRPAVGVAARTISVATISLRPAFGARRVWAFGRIRAIARCVRRRGTRSVFGPGLAIEGTIAIAPARTVAATAAGAPAAPAVVAAAAVAACPVGRGGLRLRLYGWGACGRFLGRLSWGAEQSLQPADKPGGRGGRLRLNRCGHRCHSRYGNRWCGSRLRRLGCLGHGRIANHALDHGLLAVRGFVAAPRDGGLVLVFIGQLVAGI